VYLPFVVVFCRCGFDRLVVALACRCLLLFADCLHERRLMTQFSMKT